MMHMYVVREYMCYTVKEQSHNILLQAGGLASLAPAAPDSDNFHYIAIYLHTCRCCKQGYERVDLAHTKSSKERGKGTDYVNITHLILQLYSRIYVACASLRHVT